MLLKALAVLGVLALVLGGVAQVTCGHGLDSALVVLGLWGVFALFCLWFFRDPDGFPSAEPGVVLSPAHGTVDVVDEVTETEFLAGPCRRVSIFLSVFDVHVQKAPVAGRVEYVRHHAGEFLNAMRLDSAAVNENVMLGFGEAAVPGGRMAIRLIAGAIARRILPWAQPGENVAQGERVSLIQFGSRVDVYLPLGMQVQVKLGDKVQGGITVLAKG